MQNSLVLRQEYYMCLKFLQGRKEEKVIPFPHGMLEKGQQMMGAEFYNCMKCIQGMQKKSKEQNKSFNPKKSLIISEYAETKWLQ